MAAIQPTIRPTEQAVLSVVDVDRTWNDPPSGDPLTLERWTPAVAGPHSATDFWPREDRVRRALNVTAAFLGLIVALPVMLVIAVLIKICSPGPVFFKQVRVGVDRRSPMQASTNWRRTYDHGGKLFTLYKFRTMHPNNGSAPQVWASPDDPRIFPLGRVLRQLRLDELPQLINVLKGDMNMVGPRPEQPEIFSDLREKIGRYPHRQRVLPGITGLAQVNHHYDTCLDDVRKKLSYDLTYLRRVSAVEDLRIMAQTVPAVLLRKGGW
jgi:lipopolysaccharide/colanic/teichoic acid biosynthesis glycosyltransferase